MSSKVCDIGGGLNDLEALSLAIEIEGRGRAFYEAAYQQATEAGQKELFMLLKTEEFHHMESFTKLQNDLKNSKNMSAEDQYDEESTRYVRALVAEQVFPKSENASGKIAELKIMNEILKTALQAEKDLVLLYDQLANCAKLDKAKKVFALLKIEEQNHVVLIREMLDGWA